MPSHLPLVLQTLCANLEQTLKNAEPLPWVRDEPTKEDLAHIIEQAKDSSPFDPLSLRAQTMQDLRDNKAKLITKRCKYAKILAIVYPTTKIPWNLFSKIFQAFGRANAKANANANWRIVWFANPTKRYYPSEQNQEPTSEHVNGGYAIPCRPETIVIYREEEVARVLIHELLHAACTDSPNDPVEIREAKTETWAELFLIAIQSAGKPRKALTLWKAQSQWVANQSLRLHNLHGVRTPENYSWRYTLGRREVFESLGCRLPTPALQPKPITNSLRFTHPSLD
jgi:hypothetical protein